ncbi:hypothetical protein Tco_1367794 [Tanacetum coccineum]
MRFRPETREKLKVDPPKGTLVPRVQLATGADEEAAKRYGYLALNWSSRPQVNSAPRSLIKCSLLTSRNSFSERQSLMRQTSPLVQDVKGDMDSTEFSRTISRNLTLVKESLGDYSQHSMVLPELYIVDQVMYN